jgi:hypothetical protein
MGIDQRNRFAHDVFTYQIKKDGKIFLFWEGKQVMIVKGKKAEDFLRKIEGLERREAQLLMAKVTGNFKRGNERQKGKGD